MIIIITTRKKAGGKENFKGKVANRLQSNHGERTQEAAKHWGTVE